MTSQLRKLAGIISLRLAGSSVCGACGNEFTCGVSLHGCWCSGIPLTEETRAELKTRYRDCLCQDCLNRLSRSSQLK